MDECGGGSVQRPGYCGYTASRSMGGGSADGQPIFGKHVARRKTDLSEIWLTKNCAPQRENRAHTSRRKTAHDLLPLDDRTRAF